MKSINMDKLADPVTSHAVAVLSAAASTSSLLDFVEGWLGVIGVCAAIFLTIVTIRYQLAQRRKTQIEIEILEAKRERLTGRADD